MGEKVFDDIPHSEGVANALRRAQQLAELCWTPIRPFPAVIKPELQGEDGTYPICLPAWRPQVGTNYSAARFDEKYIGHNVSIETYMTALSNPNSVLYSRSLHGKSPLSAAFYGTVCSQFVSYVMDLPFHIDCQQWPFLAGITPVAMESLDNLQLCDILNKRTRHTAVITGIRRDGEGRVKRITVTESTLPQIQSRTFTPKEFAEYWLKNGYEILRYGKINSVTYTPNPWIPIEGDVLLDRPQPNPVLMPDYGDKANYLFGETVTVSVFDPGYEAIKVFGAGKTTLLAITDGKVVLSPERVGFYQVAAVSKDGAESTPVSFCVTAATAVTDKLCYSEDETVHVTCSNAVSDELLGWVVKTAELAKYWGYPVKETGVVPDGAILPPGEYRIIALYRNAYGVYSSPPTPVFRINGRS